MHKSDLRRWISSPFAHRWPLALLMLLNYPITGSVFGNLPPYKNGPVAFELDSVVGVSAAAGVLGFGWLSKRFISNSLRASLVGWLLTAIFANAAPSLWLLTFYVEANPLETWPQPLSGVPQMFTILMAFTILIASISESRKTSKSLALQRAKLNYLSENLQRQISEVEERLHSQVRVKLDAILGNLNDKISTPVASKSLSTEIEKALNAGVRPLSWQIESEVTEVVLEPAPLQRLGLIRRLSYPITFNQSVSLTQLILILAVFDLPATYYVFGLAAVAQICLVLLILNLALLSVQKAIGNLKLPAWLIVVSTSIIAGLVSSLFVFLRLANESLTAEVQEFAIVFSFTQITLLATIFNTVINRRMSQLDAERKVNEHLEALVATLRQSAWVAKKKLARVVHGPVQSELFAAYLTLSQNDNLSEQQVHEIQNRIQSAAAYLDASDEADSTVFEQQVSDLLAGWRQVLKVEFNAQESLLDRIARDSVASACVLEVLREAITNAAKYGSSDSLNVELDIADGRFVEVRVTNPISDLQTKSDNGYGSKILDDVTHSWSLKTENDQAVFTALVALSS